MSIPLMSYDEFKAKLDSLERIALFRGLVIGFMVGAVVGGIVALGFAVHP